MEVIRSGNLSVKKMKAEIENDVALLNARYIYKNKRVKRQLNDAKLFLEMICKAPYVNCRTVSKLKKKISEERSKLKEQVLSLDRFMPGHQFTLFEEITNSSEEERKQAKKEIENLNEQIHWLHKCLGMCSSRKYFK